MRRRILPILLSVFAIASAVQAADQVVERTGSATVVGHVPLDEFLRAGGQVRVPHVVDPNSIYSNVTNFLAQAFAQGPSAPVGTGAFITRLVMDDLTFTTNPGVSNVVNVWFSVANLNAVSVTLRPRLRFWNADGPSLGVGLPNGPGTYFGTVGFSFNPIAFAAGVSTINGNVTPGFAVPAGATTTLWAGITFDSENGAGGNTGATQAQMDMIGQGFFNPVDRGSSTDTIFETTAAGSFFTVSNPAGAAVSFAGNPIANQGWQFVVTTLPVELQSFEIE